jgi:hypothetical protein
LKTGEMVGMIAQGEENDADEYKTSAIHGKINLDMKVLKEEEKQYPQMPVYYSFIDKRELTAKKNTDEQFPEDQQGSRTHCE